MVDWKEKEENAVLTIAICLDKGLKLNPNSQKQQDLYSKGLYALQVVAAQLDLLREGAK
jgi:hypothetical protein|tara:strand:+ start:4144 stop:4320 length:177 start_codon:yes stop_codon:yes gene_type:complete